MISKTQAFLFIEALSKMHEVCLDLKNGLLRLNPFTCDGKASISYVYEVHGETVEDLVKQFILKYPSLIEELIQELDLAIFPVDTDMLKEGTVYYVEGDSYHDEDIVFTEKFIGFDKNRLDELICIFEGGNKIEANHIKEIYKVIETEA